MTYSLSLLIVALLGVLTLLLTFLMPWAELGLPPAGPLAGLQTALMEAYGSAHKDPNFQYWIYSLFLALALIAAALANHIVGREDAEEKLILPIKK
jgi:hypothetical protein